MENVKAALIFLLLLLLSPQSGPLKPNSFTVQEREEF